MTTMTRRLRCPLRRSRCRRRRRKKRDYRAALSFHTFSTVVKKKNAFSNVGQSSLFAGGLVVGELGLGDTNRRMTSGHCGLGCGWRCGGAALIETGLEGMGVARRHVVTSSSNAMMIITQPQNFLPSDFSNLETALMDKA